MTLYELLISKNGWIYMHMSYIFDEQGQCIIIKEKHERNQEDFTYEYTKSMMICVMLEQILHLWGWVNKDLWCCVFVYLCICLMIT